MSAADDVDPTDPGPAGPRVENGDELAARRARRDSPNPPPHDLPTERALLGAALIDPATAATVAALDPAVFYKPGHAHIAATIAALDQAGAPVDHITVADHLTTSGLHDTIGGTQTLADLLANAGTPTSATHYAHILTGHARLRAVLGYAGEAALAAQARDLPLALRHLEAALDTTPGDTPATPLADTLAAHLDILEARQNGDTTTIPTGLADLDSIIGGLRPGELYIVAGRPAMGKSAVGGQIALNLARHDTRVLYVTAEMSTVELTDRWLSNLSGVDITRIHRGHLDQRHWTDIATTIGRLAELPIDILDDPAPTLAQIRATARTTGAQAVVIDYLQLVHATGRTNNRQEEVAEVARGAKNLARALDIPVLALAQLHRGVESRVEKRPTLPDLRDSGEIENSAGIVIGLYRHDYYHPTSTGHRGELEAIVLKNRHGAQGTATLAFLGATQRIANLAPMEHR